MMRQTMRLCASVAGATLAATLLQACGTQDDKGAAPSVSTTMDIYTNDAQTRKPATTTQVLWTVQMGGCTGSMLSPKHMLTANHCSPAPGAVYTSGACLSLGCTRDLRAVRRVESNASMDYAIMEVEWLRQDSKAAQKYTPTVQRRDDQLTFGRDGTGTAIFTVGFPTDKRGAQHATGTAKAYRGETMVYNVGSINGNSGGAMWRANDFMLVGMTNFGPHQYGQAGWNNNNPESSSAWNGGPKMSAVYARSATLKAVFPNGVSLYANADGSLKAE